jgi:hypothetical protein
VPLADGIQRLLGDQDFTLTYSADGALRAIRLHGDGRHARGSRAAPFLGLLDGRPPVTVTPRLSDALGVSTASLRALVRVALGSADPALRTEALVVVLNVVDGDAALRDRLVELLGSIDDVAATAMLRDAAGEHAEDVLREVATRARASELRAKAGALLLQLRAQAAEN